MEKISQAQFDLLSPTEKKSYKDKLLEDFMSKQSTKPLTNTNMATKKEDIDKKPTKKKLEESPAKKAPEAKKKYIKKSPKISSDQMKLDLNTPTTPTPEDISMKNLENVDKNIKSTVMSTENIATSPAASSSVEWKAWWAIQKKPTTWLANIPYIDKTIPEAPEWRMKIIAEDVTPKPLQLAWPDKKVIQEVVKDAEKIAPWYWKKAMDIIKSMAKTWWKYVWEIPAIFSKLPWWWKVVWLISWIWTAYYIADEFFWDPETAWWDLVPWDEWYSDPVVEDMIKTFWWARPLRPVPWKWLLPLQEDTNLKTPSWKTWEDHTEEQKNAAYKWILAKRFWEEFAKLKQDFPNITQEELDKKVVESQTIWKDLKVPYLKPEEWADNPEFKAIYDKFKSQLPKSKEDNIVWQAIWDATWKPTEITSANVPELLKPESAADISQTPPMETPRIPEFLMPQSNTSVANAPAPANTPADTDYFKKIIDSISLV